MKRKEEGKVTVMPIFYDVEPSEVRNQKRKYEEAFDKHELTNKEKVESWRKALVDASNISGWETKQIANGHEAQGIKQIVDEISQRLVTLRANEDLVGMRTRVQGLESELQICCFVNNIREESRKNGLEKLQEKLLSCIFKQKQVQEVRRVEEGRHMIMARLRHKKVLIVLDDVDQVDQLRALVGSRDWFGEGSRIIITTRNEHILNAHGVDVIHQINLLNNDEAVRLFRKYAHRDCTPKEDFEKLSTEVVSYAGRLPLALKVLGSFLCGRNSMQWRSALDRLKDIPHKDIIGILRISFDGLEQDEKDLFLDIACFFRWDDTSQAMKCLDACGYHSVIGVEVLRQKALVVITKDGKFDMHDLVQEMGRYIVREEHPKNPEKHSRVWKTEDVQRILHMAATTELDNIEAIDLSDLHFEDGESQRFLQVAGNMKKLRWIDFFLEKGQCPLHCYEETNENIVPLPVNFPPSNLCYLYANGCIPQKQLWKGYKYLPNLTHMSLINLSNLIKIPDFSGLPKLETFKLKHCPCLEEIHPSIGSLESLIFLSIKLCPSLVMFPSIIRIKKLKTLVFSECCLGDEEIASFFWELPNLEKLDLSDNPLISRLDFSILRLPWLKWIDVSWCKGLVVLLELPSSIAIVTADYCDSLESFGDISNCKGLWNVSLCGNNKLDQLCGDILIHSMLQGSALEDHYINVALHQHQLPNGLIGRLFRRNTFRLHLPDDWYKDFCGFLICLVTDAWSRSGIKITIKQEDPPFDLYLLHESDEAVEPIYEESMTYVGYVPFSSLRQTKLLTSSYNIILVTKNHMGTYGGIELIPRKSKSNEVQTTDCSEFRDKKLQDAGSKTFKIQQCDSQSSIEISWKPFIW